MKIALFVTFLASSCSAFVVHPKSSGTFPSSVSLAATIVEPEITSTSSTAEVTKAAKEDLLLACRRLKDQHGIFLIDKKSRDEFQAVVKELEDVSNKPRAENFGEMLLGDWTLLCTTSTAQPGVDESKIPGFLKEGPLQQLRDNIRQATNRYLTVSQVIKKAEDDGDKAYRIDHVLEYCPPNKFKDFLDNVPSQFDRLNINPLEVSKSKLSLIHSASISDELKTKLVLKSIVVNVAGKATFLDPNGKDLIGINLPWGEFTAGEFETTFMDETVRISRGKQGPFEQLRVFVRSGTEVTAGVVEDIAEMEARGKLDSTVNVGDEGQDVDESSDPDFDVLPPDY